MKYCDHENLYVYGMKQFQCLNFWNNNAWCCFFLVETIFFVCNLESDFLAVEKNSSFLSASINTEVDLQLQQNLSDVLSAANNSLSVIMADQFNISFMLAKYKAEKTYATTLQNISTTFPALFLTNQAEIDNIASALQSLNQMLTAADHAINNLTVLASSLNSSANASSVMLVLASGNISAVAVELKWALGNITSLQELVEGENTSQLIDGSGLIASSWDLPTSLQELSTEVLLLGQQLYGSFEMINDAIVHADNIAYQSQYICK